MDFPINRYAENVRVTRYGVASDFLGPGAFTTEMWLLLQNGAFALGPLTASWGLRASQGILGP
eukprot:592365-Pyramimonas_sp.AAC.1